jgi:gluconolactonase
MRPIITASICFLLLAAGDVHAQKTLRRFELKPESSAFLEVFPSGVALEKVAGGFGFTEGPLWDERGFLYVSDEQQNKLFRVFPDGGKETVVELGDADGSAIDKRHRLINCASVLRALTAIEPNGRYEMLADKYGAKNFNNPNDVVPGPDGALCFTDPTLDLPKGEKQEIPFQGVYRLGEDGSVRLLTMDLAQPNGLAFSPDGKRLYIDDSKRREIRVYDFDSNAQLVSGRLFGKEEGTGGVPDGMRVDMNGNHFVTGPLGIWVWDPNGNHLATIIVPEQPANLAWGEAGYQTLYVTAGTSIYRLKTKTHGFVPGGDK